MRSLYFEGMKKYCGGELCQMNMGDGTCFCQSSLEDIFDEKPLFDLDC
jgi:hypothetical protein